jgi:hypothetical protein
MAQRGRPKKSKTETSVVVKKEINQAAVDLKVLEIVRTKEMEALYIDLAKVKSRINDALNRIGFIDESENLSEAAFKAGRAYNDLDKANDKLEEILDNINNTYDLEHWSDINDN